MNLKRHTYETRSQKIIDFVIGYIAWFVLNTLFAVVTYGLVLGLAMLPSTTSTNSNTDLWAMLINLVGLVCSSIPWIVNIVLIIYFALTRYWIALGAIAAFVTAQLVALCLGLAFVGVCFAAMAGISGGFGR